MTQLPAAFTEKTRLLMGEERFMRYLKSFEEDAPVSIRLNPMKMAAESQGETRVESQVLDSEPVPWCRHAYYLKQRPNFTMDPLFHAGCYYVQEAASMFLDEVLRQHAPLTAHPSPLTSHRLPLTALDMCAAPGGKSTLLRSALPEDSVLYSNEPIRKRADILLENVTKWGYTKHYVTNAYPRDYRKAKAHFDIILCDVPCSGEGMFRKDEATIREWSPQQVEKCWSLQRDIVSDAWNCLNAGGLLVYSTCTFNTQENEENIRWMLETYDDAEALTVETKPEWHITGSLLEGFDVPVYRFIPGISRSEGLFLCVLRKKGERLAVSGKRIEVSVERLENPPSSFLLSPSSFNVDVTYQQAIAYLRGEALVLPDDAPRGVATVSFEGYPLGQVKNIGSRANNLYPKPWRIKTTHVPVDYEPIIMMKHKD